MKTLGRVVLIVIILLFVAGLARGRAQLFLFGNPLEGQKAPDFTLPTLTQKAVSLGTYQGAQPAIMFFWATWCPHCRTALQDLNMRQQEIQGQGVKIILVNTGEEKAKVASYMKQHGIGLDVFLDEDSSVAERYSIVGVPTFVLIARNGLIHSMKHVLPQDYRALLAQ